MPRAHPSHFQPSKSHKAKTPYASTSHKAKAKPNVKAPPAVWTEEMDETVISHVMAHSEIWIKFDWQELIRESFPRMNVAQIQRRWERVIKRKILPSDLPAPSTNPFPSATTKRQITRTPPRTRAMSTSTSGTGAEQPKKQQIGKKNGRGSGSKMEDMGLESGAEENEWEEEE